MSDPRLVKRRATAAQDSGEVLTFDSDGAAPSAQLYGALERAYQHFNVRLFDGALPPCLLTVQRERNVMGFFSAHRWLRNPTGDRVHEIAINPAYFARQPLIQLFQTLVHEQVHLWQHEYGKPSRASYHNGEWAAKMEAIGLMPSDTGAPGGRPTGQKMSDYPIPGGAFEQACLELVGAPGSEFALPMVDRVPPLKPCPVRGPLPSGATGPAPCDADASAAVNMEGAVAGSSVESAHEAAGTLSVPLDAVIPGLAESAAIRAEAARKLKTKYQCRGCGTNVWGRAGLNLVCGDCQRVFSCLGSAG